MGRLLVALPISVLIAGSLFSFMAWMVDKGHQRAPKPSEVVRFDMVMVEQEDELQRRTRSVPEQPQPPQAPEPMDVSQTQTSLDPISQVTPIAAMGLNTSLEGIAISAPNLKGTMGNQQVLPLYRVEPRYPSNALKRKMEGYVVMRFTIDPTGRPVDIEVIESNPKRIFEREAVRALKKWKYQPKLEDGTAVSQPGRTARVEFKLPK